MTEPDTVPDPVPLRVDVPLCDTVPVTVLDPVLLAVTVGDCVVDLT